MNETNLWFDEYYTKHTKLSIAFTEHLYTEQSKFQKIDFFRSEDFGVFFTLDGYMMVNEKDEFIYHDMIVHTPMAVNPNIKTILVIGGGDGGTVRELTRYPSIKKIDLVEIDEMVVRNCKKFLPITSSKLDDKRVNIYYEDGIEFVNNTETIYDLIIVDSTDPIGPGEGLFTKDFYSNCFSILSDDGILINQHESPYFENDAREMKRAHSKLKNVFPICLVYQFHMPTYASGHWLFGFASKKFHPINDVKHNEWDKFIIQTKYYNKDIHKGSFALPTYVNEMLKNC